MDGWQIAGWVLGLIFNVPAVAVVRRVVQEKGEHYFFGRGRGAFVLIFALCFIEQLILGHFEALGSAQSFLALIQHVTGQASTVAVAAMGLHAGLGLASDQIAKKLP